MPVKFDKRHCECKPLSRSIQAEKYNVKKTLRKLPPSGGICYYQNFAKFIMLIYNKARGHCVPFSMEIRKHGYLYVRR